MNGLSEKQFFCAVCAVLVLATVLILVAVGLIPSWGAIPN
jgi:hypothetical protein